MMLDDDTILTGCGHGSWVAPGFEPVATAFAQMLARPEELGAALCIYHQGRPVVDLWGGHAAPGRNRLWQRDSVVSLFSAGKACAALCLLHLVDRGLAGLDDPVIAHWPEFARVDGDAKSKVTLGHLLHHTAGLPVARTNRPGDVYDWPRMISALERARLLWPAGSKTAYHAVTFGHLVGEVVRRISGQMPSDYFNDHFGRPLGLDLSLRLLPQQKSRLAECDGYGWKVRARCAVFSHILPWVTGWKGQYFRPCGSDYHPSSPAWQAAEAPAVTGFGNARGLARLYSALAGGGVVDGIRVLSAGMVDAIALERPQPVQDMVFGLDTRIGLGVYFNLAPIADLGPNPNSFGHVGMGGTTSFADPDHGIGFGYVNSHLYQPKAGGTSIIGMRARELADVFYDCLKRA